MKRVFSLVCLCFLAAQASAGAQMNAQGLEFFENKIRPVLAQHCYACHSAEAQQAKKLKGGLLLDTRDGVRKGGDSGPALVAGKPRDSLLVKALHYGEELRMPPKGKLSAAVIADFEKWIALGAPDPREGRVAAGPKRIDVEAGKRSWAFQPLQSVALPTVKARGWGRTAVDAFILQKQEEKGVTPNAPVSPEKLIRRLYFDLWGLPPSPEDVDGFTRAAAVNTEEATAHLVERLLASPHYGERWARHWLDIARFAESGGYEFDGDRAGAYLYRDFVIRALADGMPFDEFVRLQLAGDQLRPGDYRAATATGFVVAGPYPGQITAKTRERIRYDHLDDMLSTVGQALLGLSLGCARCHDHKYDPVPQEDYYRLLACLGHTDSSKTKVDPQPEVYRQAKAQYEREHALLVAALDKYRREELQGKLALTPGRREFIPRTLRALDPELRRLLAAVDQHAKSKPQQKLLDLFVAGDTSKDAVFLLVRGEVERKNGVAKPGFLQVLTQERDERWTAAARPRVALAKWLTDTDAGAGRLLARVIVNRLWQHHLGRGLVATPNDFGSQGEPPSHPELLDYLASELIKNGWHLKPIHKLIVLSAVYQQAGEANPTGVRVDPQNRLWWRRPPRRLEAEVIRDALLAVSGTLDPALYGPGTLDENSPRRSVYLTVKRSKLVPFLQMFDAPEAIQSIAVRSTTTVATQALALLNSPLVRQRAEKLAQRVAPKSPGLVHEAIEDAYRLALGRRPTDGERERMAAFLDNGRPVEQALADACQLILCLNEFIYVD